MNGTETPRASEVPPQPAMPPQPVSTRMRTVLILSLAANLLFVGLLGGAAIGGRWRPDHRASMDVGFGPLTAALTREDRKAMGQSFMRNSPAVQADRQAAKADFGDLVKALRADPWDRAMAEAALARQSGRSLARMERGRAVLLDHIDAMSPQARQDFATRIEAALARRRSGGGD